MGVTWGSLSTTENVDVTLSAGIEPSAFAITVAPPIDDTIPTDADLVIDDGINDALTFSDCRIAANSITHNTNDRTMSFTVRDRRWKWAKADLISGEYNRRDATGSVVSTGDDKKTGQELAIILLTALGETGADVGALPDGYPYLKMEWDRPAQALESICSKYGCVISLKTDNTIHIYRVGRGETLPTLTPIARTFKEPIYDKPAKTTLICGRSKYQIDLKLTAVGFDPDSGTSGGWVPMKTVDGGPPSWRPSVAGYYFGFQDSVDGEEARRAAQATAWRTYALPATVTIAGESINIIKLLEYWSTQLVDTGAVDNQWGQAESRKKEAYVTGMHFTQAAMTDSYALLTYLLRPRMNVDVGFQIDRDRDLVIFDEQVFYIDPNFDFEFFGADLTLTCAFDYDKGAYSQTFDDGQVGMVDRIERDDIVFEYHVDDSGTATLENFDALLPRMQDYITGAMTKYSISGDYYTKTFSGFIDIWPDGNIMDVSWATDTTNGPMTMISYGESTRSMKQGNKDYLLNSAKLANAEKQRRETG